MLLYLYGKGEGLIQHFWVKSFKSLQIVISHLSIWKQPSFSNVQLFIYLSVKIQSKFYYVIQNSSQNIRPNDFLTKQLQVIIFQCSYLYSNHKNHVI